MDIDNEQKLKRIHDCRRLYLEHKGQHHEQIEAEMRKLGYTDFHRRILYRRFERGRLKSGWIERYGWERMVRDEERSGDTLVPTDAASAFGANADNHAAQNDRNGLIARPRHAGGTGVAARDACVPGIEGVPVIQGFPGTEGNSGGNGKSEAENDFVEFRSWLKQVSPSMTWDWKYQVHIYKRLQRVTDGRCKRLMLFMPPRHGKSELVTVRYSAWRLTQDPKLNIIVGSYNQKLANKFSRKIRRVLNDAAFAGNRRRPRLHRCHCSGRCGE